MPFQEDSHKRSVVPIFINGRSLPIDETRLAPVISSKTDEPVHYFVSANNDDCNAACEAAWEAFVGSRVDANNKGWKRASVATRREVILKAVELFEKRIDELVEAQVSETSCDPDWAKYNVTIATDYMRELASCVSRIAGEIPPIEKPDTLAFVFKEAVGPILIIPPWNGAVILATRAITAAIGAGCTVVLKGSELSPKTHNLIVDIYHDAGLPVGVLNSLQASRDQAGNVTEALIANESIRKIDFIGSPAVGRIVGSTAAKHLKPVLMELGGKGPAIVLDDADLSQAAGLCVRGAFMHHGQICMSTERIIVLRSVAEKFQKLLKEMAASFSGSTAVSSKIAENARSILQDAHDKGNTFLIGGPEMAHKNGVRPSLVVVDPKTSKKDLRIVDEETFGPSASLYIVDSEAEAIRVANSSSFGLNSTIHSTNLERALRLARDLECGQVHINTISFYVSAMGPQGGTKGSGWGRQNAHWGLEEFLQEKFVTYYSKDSNR